MILLALSAHLEGKKRKNIPKMDKEDREFLLKVGEKRYTDISPRNFAKLQELKDKYL
jgi:hypothetical protein